MLKYRQYIAASVETLTTWTFSSKKVSTYFITKHTSACFFLDSFIEEVCKCTKSLQGCKLRTYDLQTDAAISFKSFAIEIRVIVKDTALFLGSLYVSVFSWTKFITGSHYGDGIIRRKLLFKLLRSPLQSSVVQLCPVSPSQTTRSREEGLLKPVIRSS